MRFVIGQGRRKREINGPFGICASRRDMVLLRDQIDAWLADPGNGCGISYGWLFVQERVIDMGPLDTSPEPWE